MNSVLSILISNLIITNKPILWFSYISPLFEIKYKIEINEDKNC